MKFSDIKHDFLVGVKIRRALWEKDVYVMFSNGLTLHVPENLSVSWHPTDEDFQADDWEYSKKLHWWQLFGSASTAFDWGHVEQADAIPNVNWEFLKVQPYLDDPTTYHLKLETKLEAYKRLYDQNKKDS